MDRKTRRRIFGYCLYSEDPTALFCLVLRILNNASEELPLTRKIIVASLNIAMNYLESTSFTYEDLTKEEIREVENIIVSQAGFTCEYFDEVFYIRKEEKPSTITAICECLICYCLTYDTSHHPKTLADTCLKLVSAHYGLVREKKEASGQCEAFVYDCCSKFLELGTFEVPTSIKEEWVVFINNFAVRKVEVKEDKIVINPPTNNKIIDVYDKKDLSNLKVIGSGVHSKVFSASLNQKSVACKLFLLEGDDVCLPTTFLTELSILNSVSHPNLISIAGIVPESTMLLFPLAIANASIWRRGSIKLQDSVVTDLVNQLVLGYEVIEDNGIIHTDIKPENILVYSEGGKLIFRYCDFSSAIRTNVVRFEEFNPKLVTTLWYRAPELLLNEKRLTSKIDVWSLGCTIWEIINAKYLFATEDEDDQLELIRYTYDSVNVDKVPDEVGKVIKRCIVFNPEERANAKELRDILI